MILGGLSQWVFIGTQDMEGGQTAEQTKDYTYLRLEGNYRLLTSAQVQSHWWQTHINCYNPLDGLVANSTTVWAVRQKEEALEWFQFTEQYQRLTKTLYLATVEDLANEASNNTPAQRKAFFQTQKDDMARRWQPVRETLVQEWRAWAALYWQTSLAPLFQTYEQHQAAVEEAQRRAEEGLLLK